VTFSIQFFASLLAPSYCFPACSGAVDESRPTVFSQLVEFLPPTSFKFASIVSVQGNRYVKDFSCWDSPLFGLCSAHLCESSAISKLVFVLNNPSLSYGLPGQVSRNTLAHATNPRLADLRRFRPSLDCRRSRLYRGESFGVLSETVYALDSTTIDLLSLFPWENFAAARAR